MAVHAWSIPPLTTGGVGIIPAYEIVRDELREAAAETLAREIEAAASAGPGVAVDAEVPQADPAAL